MRKLFTLSVLTLSIVQPTKAMPPSKISVFTTQHYPIHSAHLAHHIYYIDRVELLEEQFSQGFSTNPQQAEVEARNMMKTAQWQQFEQNLKQAYTGVIEGWKNGIMKVPAILFESQQHEPMVIYGETDIGKAIQLYRNKTIQGAN